MRGSFPYVVTRRLAAEAFGTSLLAVAAIMPEAWTCHPGHLPARERTVRPNRGDPVSSPTPARQTQTKSGDGPSQELRILLSAVRVAGGVDGIAHRFLDVLRVVTAIVVVVVGVTALSLEAQGQSEPLAAEIRAEQETGDRKRQGPTGDVVSEQAVELQRQINELRTDLLDERERRLDRRLEGNGTLLVLIGITIGIGGIWIYARFRSIATLAKIGAAAVQGQMAGGGGRTAHGSAALGPHGYQLKRIHGTLPDESSANAVAALPATAPLGNDDILCGASGGSQREAAEPNGQDSLGRTETTHKPSAAPGPGRSAANSKVFGSGSVPSSDLDSCRDVLGADECEMQQNEDVIADCTEALRSKPDSVQLLLERGEAWSRQRRYESAIADFDRAIRLDPDNSAAYFGRCQAKSELGRHEEAIEDYDELMRLAPASPTARPLD